MFVVVPMVQLTDRLTKLLGTWHDGWKAWEKTWHVAYHCQLHQVYARHFALLHYRWEHTSP